MELVHIFKELRSHPWLLAGAAVLALLVALAVSMRGETVKGAAASTEILVDASDSALGDLRRDTVPLIARSDIFARFLGAGGVTGDIARETGVPAEEVAVVGPALSIDGVPDPAAAERATTLTEDSPYQVQVRQGDGLPVLTLFAQGPDPEAAGDLADATVLALERYVSNYQEQAGTPPERRVAIRQLGATQVSEFETKPGLIAPIVAFVFVLGICCVAILSWPTIKETWRSPDALGAVHPASNGVPRPGGERGSPALRPAIERALTAMWPPPEKADEPAEANPVRRPKAAGKAAGAQAGSAALERRGRSSLTSQAKRAAGE